MKLLKSKRAIAVTAIAALTVIGTGIGAFASWTQTGNGAGSAPTGTASNYTVTTDAAVTGGPLTPGGPLETITYHVKNNSTGHQNLNTVTIRVASNVLGVSTTWTTGQSPIA